MSTLEGIKRAYAWEYKDKSRCNRGGRISATEFINLEAGHYGNVVVIDMQDYLEHWEDAFDGFRSASQASMDVLLVARLGSRAYDYLRRHDEIARRWHLEEAIGLPESGRPYILQNSGAPNCPYMTFQSVNGQFDWSRKASRPIEAGYAVGHLLSISPLDTFRASGWRGLISTISCHEWWNGVRFVGVPSGASLQGNIANAPQPNEVLRRDWPRFMRPNNDEAYTPPQLFLVEQMNGEWFTYYPKPADKMSPDSADIEFHVRSVEEVGELGQFQVKEDFFLYYRLSQIIAIAPRGVNAYKIVDSSQKDSGGHTTVTVRFYRADVDTSQRLPWVQEIKQDYNLLMG